MRDIEQSAAVLGTSVQVLLEDSETVVLHGQFISSEGDHLAAASQVKVVKSGSLKLLGGGC
jgi:hypothetical protein